MFRDASFDRMRQLFEDQFTPDGDSFLYRRNLRGPAYRVSAAERDGFVSDYNRFVRRSFWRIVLGTIVVIIGFAGIGIWLDIQPSTFLISVPIVLLLFLFLITNYRAFRAPARTLDHRVPAAAALSGSTARSEALRRITWQQFVGIGGGLAAMLAVALMRPHPLAGWNVGWIVVLVALLVGIGVRAAQKWRFEHDG